MINNCLKLATIFVILGSILLHAEIPKELKGKTYSGIINHIKPAEENDIESTLKDYGLWIIKLDFKNKPYSYYRINKENESKLYYGSIDVAEHATDYEFTFKQLGSRNAESLKNSSTSFRFTIPKRYFSKSCIESHYIYIANAEEAVPEGLFLRNLTKAKNMNFVVDGKNLCGNPGAKCMMILTETQSLFDRLLTNLKNTNLFKYLRQNQKKGC